MKKYTFKLNNNNTTSYNNKFSNSFCTSDYSKMLDDLILDDIIEKNSWLKTKKEDALIDGLFDSSKKYTTFYDTDFAKAAKFLANYGKPSCTWCPFKKNKTYELSDGTIITITDDYIHINEKMYFFNLFNDYSFLNTLTNNEKKTICTIYTDSLKITIKA